MNQFFLETTGSVAGPAVKSVERRVRQPNYRAILPIFILAAAALAAHGWSILDGPFFDDHLHMTRYASNDWSGRHLLDATTITPDQFMESWWQDQPIRWQYARPFSVLLSQVVYHLSGGSVKALHALSVVLHFAGAVLVYYLCRLLTRRPAWALVGGLLFVVHSHSVYAVGWLAAQNSVLQTILTLAALLCYIRASRLNVYAGRLVSTTSEKTLESGGGRSRLSEPNGSSSDGSNGNGHIPAGRFSESRSRSAALALDRAQPEHQHVRRPGSRLGEICSRKEPHAEITPISKLWLGLTLLFWILALASRENAIVFPAFALAFDLAFGGRRHLRRRIGAYLVLAAVAIAFAFWRFKVFYAPMPAFYVRPYDGPEYVFWWIAKLLHYVTGVIWLSPLMIGPSARFNPFREVPGDCLLMLTIIAIMATGYYLACRRAKGWWIWPGWILLSLLPVVPVFAGPHSAYMPAVGFAVAMVLGPALRHEIQPVSIGRWCKPVALWFLIATTIYMPIYRTFWGSVQAAEQLTVAQMAAAPPPPATTDVFLINLPLVNIYTRLHLAEELSKAPARGTTAVSHDFHCHVLTYATDVLRVEPYEECRLEQVDPYTFRLSISGRGYFSGALGRFVIEAMHPAGRMHAGDVHRGPLFDAEVLKANADGVQELEFRFHKLLASPQYCFYLGTNHQPAVRVHFWGTDQPKARPEDSAQSVSLVDIQKAAEQLDSGQAQAAGILFRGINSPDPKIRITAMTVFRQGAIAVAKALAAPVQDVLGRSDWSIAERAQVQQWWEDSVGDEALAVAWVRRAQWEPLQCRRDRLFTIQQIASRIIQTDLYMTGPPYPSPR